MLETLCVQSILGAPGRRRRAQPVAELAAEPQDIKSRLAGVPVYTVANKKNEFVLVSGEVRASLSLEELLPCLVHSPVRVSYTCAKGKAAPCQALTSWICAHISQYQ